MYSTCLYCNLDLGSNDTIEHQSVGRRLAFDGAQGRLWVVCVVCARWNLVPFDQRLEAIDECERQFRNARARFSTDHIGLARINAGLELIRIGAALRPEFAAWRYGRTLRRRRRRLAPESTQQGGVAGRIDAWIDRAMRLITLPIWDAEVRPAMAVAEHRLLRDPWTDHLVAVPVAAMAHSAMVIDGALQWQLEVPYRTELDGLLGADPLRLLSIRDHPTAGLFRGTALLPTLGRALPVFERRRPGSAEVAEAIRLLERTWGDSQGLFAYIADKPLRLTTRRSYPVAAMPPELRLALEMAAHEETERRAMEGELKLLEREWREADRVARIADDLAVVGNRGEGRWERGEESR